MYCRNVNVIHIKHAKTYSADILLWRLGWTFVVDVVNIGFLLRPVVGDRVVFHNNRCVKMDDEPAVCSGLFLCTQVDSSLHVVVGLNV